MDQGKYIFGQLTDFLTCRIFNRLVEKYEGNKHVRSFTFWNKWIPSYAEKAIFMSRTKDILTF
jgi:hypothetical protein